MAKSTMYRVPTPRLAEAQLSITPNSSVHPSYNGTIIGFSIYTRTDKSGQHRASPPSLPRSCATRTSTGYAPYPAAFQVLPHRHVVSIEELDGAEQASFADAPSRLTVRYDNLFQTFRSLLERPVPEDATGHCTPAPSFLPSAPPQRDCAQVSCRFEMLAEIQRHLTGALNAPRSTTLIRRRQRQPAQPAREDPQTAAAA